MSYLYVTELGSHIGIRGNRIEIKYKDDMLRSLPVETVDVIEVFGNVLFTTQCIQECLKRGISVIFSSSNGAYFGRLISTNHVNVARQRLQAKITDDPDFCLGIAGRIINAKINNQIVILRRYARNQNIDVGDEISTMKRMANLVKTADSVEKVMGSEGYAAKTYFSALGKLVDRKFAFKGRNKRPPKDPFNSMISLGYSIVMNEMYGKIEGKGLNPYFGILHQDREKHPTLASDLMEEWRAPLIDTTVMSMINGHEVQVDDFKKDPESGGVFLSKKAFKDYVSKLEKKFSMKASYLDYIDYSVSFRSAMVLQVESLIKAMENHDPELYHPLRIR